MYDLETAKVIEEIKQASAKKVCLQFPDGLKQYSKEIADSIQKETGAVVLIWGSTNFGSCDLPISVKNLGVDMLIHYGHAAWQDFGKRDYGKVDLD